MVDKQSYMFLTGPKVVKAITHEDVDTDSLGGAGVHTSRSGVAHLAAEDEIQAINYLKQIISFIPQNNMETTPKVPTNDPESRMEPLLDHLIPDNPNVAYNIKDVILNTVDDGNFLEIQPNFAGNIVVGFARYGGISVGIVANQPNHLAGVLDCDASVKGARFVRFCDAFNIPVVTLVDVPGFLPGTIQEHGGIIRHGAKILYAYAEATIPKVTVITRKGYGGAYCVMSSKHLRGDINYAWPTAEIAVMGAKGATEVLYAREAGKNPDSKDAFLKEKEQEYGKNFANPYIAAKRGYVDDIIQPSRTRFRIIRALIMLENKQDSNPPKKHGNIPL